MACALFLRHGVSFVYNYLLKGEFASARPEKLMISPYSRIAVVHVAIIAGVLCFFLRITKPRIIVEPQERLSSAAAF